VQCLRECTVASERFERALPEEVADHRGVEDHLPLGCRERFLTSSRASGAGSSDAAHALSLPTATSAGSVAKIPHASLMTCPNAQ
jgi:hypothetical protein